MAVLMLTLFALASSHSLLEGFGLIHQHEAQSQQAGHDSGDSDHALADGTVAVDVHRDEVVKRDAAPTFVAQIAALVAVLVNANVDCSSEHIFTSGVADHLATTWQFSLRSALPARAPSCV